MGVVVVGDTESLIGNYGFPITEIYLQLADIRIRKIPPSEKYPDGTISVESNFNVYSSPEARQGGAKPLFSHTVNLTKLGMENLFDFIFSTLKKDLIDKGMDARDHL